jgi:multicomponent Na+:H+ antiporter subunit E
MFGFWILLSGKFDLFHLTLGVISSALVSFLSADLFMYEQGKNRLSTGLRFLMYLPWLLYQIVLSTMHVTFLALHPKMKDRIDPTIVIEDQVFYVHAISRKAAAGLPGEMEERLAKVFERD